MNYAKVYFQLIEKRKHEKPTNYSEKHHIIPRCMGGSDNSANIVRLTAREHYIAHALLVHMYADTEYHCKLTSAFILMSSCSSINQKRKYKVNSILYEKLRKAHSLYMSNAQSGDKNSQYNTLWVTNYTLKQSKKVNATDTVEQGWCHGRVINWKAYDIKQKNKAMTKYKKMLSYAYAENEKYDYYYSLFVKYKDGNYMSIRHFCKTCDDVALSHVTITKYWNKFNFLND